MRRVALAAWMAVSLCAGCLLPDIQIGEGAGAEASTSTAATSSHGTGGGGTGSGGTGGQVRTSPTTATLVDDRDDAMWFDCVYGAPAHEVLSEEPEGESSIYIAQGAYDECIGLRFALQAIPKGATIEEAKLTLWQLRGLSMDQLPEVNSVVHAWDSVEVPPFADESDTPANHGGGVYLSKSAQIVLSTNTPTAAPEPVDVDVRLFVEELVNKEGWSEVQSTIGFVIQAVGSRDKTVDIRFRDASAGSASQFTTLAVKWHLSAGP